MESRVRLCSTWTCNSHREIGGRRIECAAPHQLPHKRVEFMLRISRLRDTDAAFSGEIKIQKETGNVVACPGHDNAALEGTISDVPNATAGNVSNHNGPYVGVCSTRGSAAVIDCSYSRAATQAHAPLLRSQSSSAIVLKRLDIHVTSCITTMPTKIMAWNACA